MIDNILRLQKRYFDKKNSIFNRIKENQQKIKIIELNDIGFNERLHIEHLIKENDKFRELLIFEVF